MRLKQLAARQRQRNLAIVLREIRRIGVDLGRAQDGTLSPEKLRTGLALEGGAISQINVDRK